MNVIRSIRIAGTAAVALLAMSLTPNHANAQAFTGKFTLPFQANWDRVVLPAGEYSFSIDNLVAGGRIVIARDGKNVGMVQVATVSDFSTPPKSEMVAATTAAGITISVLRLDTGYTIRFLPPNEGRRARGHGPALTYNLPISGGRS